MTNEIIVYQTDTQENIEVRIEQDTVWLTQAQMADLFQTSRNNITIHTSNIFKEGELQKISVCKNSLLTAADGKSYKTTLYNLDVIISIGYRVKSQRGTQFRIWANSILKEYMLKGYVVQSSIRKLEKDVHDLQQKSKEFELYIQSSLPPKQGIFFDGQVFDAYTFVADIIRLAHTSIILIDNYIDDTILTLLAKRKEKVQATIFTQQISKQLQLDIEKHNIQYPKIEVKTYTQSHDRFLILDSHTVYHIGASLKDLGKKWFAFSKLEIDAEIILSKLLMVNY
ncbi:MAG: hypothetical protein BWY22_01788 [Bacteroidetes bacterium ADurb.Bin217]|nr:MAG: hypothetical protein BWY22_01788 [Bacteroidetes bacterium ADurb.Bin217]